MRSVDSLQVGGSNPAGRLTAGRRFYKGLDIKYHALGYATRMTPQKRGVYDVHTCA